MNSYEEGWEDYYIGYSINENPYEYGTFDWEEWNDGWKDAMYIDNERDYENYNY